MKQNKYIYYIGDGSETNPRTVLFSTPDPSPNLLLDMSPNLILRHILCFIGNHTNPFTLGEGGGAGVQIPDCAIRHR